MKSLFFLPVLFLLTPAFLFSSALAENQPLDSVTLPPGVAIRTEGQLLIPKGATQSAWLDFMGYFGPSQKASEFARNTLGATGWKWAQDQKSSAMYASLSGYVRIHNYLPNSRDTGQIRLADVLEEGMEANSLEKQQTTQDQDKSSRGALGHDAGVAHQLGRQGGGMGSGIVGAIMVDWLANATGLRAAMSRALSGAGGGKENWPDKPFFCGSDCETMFSSLNNEVRLNFRTMQGTEAGPYYTVIVNKFTREREDPTPLIEIALNRMMQDLAKEAAQ